MQIKNSLRDLEQQMRNSKYELDKISLHSKEKEHEARLQALKLKELRRVYGIKVPMADSLYSTARNTSGINRSLFTPGEENRDPRGGSPLPPRAPSFNSDMVSLSETPKPFETNEPARSPPIPRETPPPIVDPPKVAEPVMAVADTEGIGLTKMAASEPHIPLAGMVTPTPPVPEAKTVENSVFAKPKFNFR